MIPEQRRQFNHCLSEYLKVFNRMNVFYLFKLISERERERGRERERVSHSCVALLLSICTLRSELLEQLKNRDNVHRD